VHSPFPTITRGLLAFIKSLAASLTSVGSGHVSGGSGQMAVCTTLLLATCSANRFPGKSKYDTPIEHGTDKQLD